MSMKNFQSTPPRRRRRFHKRDCLGNEIFNPRLREGGDIYLIKNGYSCNLFQSTPPRRRRQKFAVFPVGAGKTFQSTPPRRRRRQFIVYPCKKSIFSIHASAKEATFFPHILFLTSVLFNPRLREGGDMLHPITLNALL